MTVEDMLPYPVAVEHIEAVGRINYVRYYKDVRTDNMDRGTSYEEYVPVHKEMVDMTLEIASMSVGDDPGVGTGLGDYDMDTGEGKGMVGYVHGTGHWGLNLKPVLVPVLAPEGDSP